MKPATHRFPEISTVRLRLRQIVDQDLDNIFQGLSHPEVIQFYGVSFDSLEATREQMAWYAGLEKSGRGLWWAICDKEKGTFFGAAGLNDVNPTHARAEVGLWLLPQFWGQGIMGEAMPRVLRYGFEQLKLHRIEGFVESENLNCKRALAKLQFEHEGTLRDCEIKNGRFISLDVFAKFAAGD